MDEPKSNVNFVCQRCHQPIRLDPSIYNAHENSELLVPIEPLDSHDLHLEGHLTAVDTVVSPFHLTESGSACNGFTLVCDAEESTILSHQLHVTARLFDIMSQQSPIDHPLCEECTDSLLNMMEKQLNMTQKEWHDYSEYQKKLQLEEDKDDLDGLKKDLDDLLHQEQRLISELTAIEKHEQIIKEDIEKRLKEEASLARDEDRYWRAYAEYQRDLIAAEDDKNGVDCQTRYASSQLEKLKKTNIFNVTFHIWHSGQFGTINTFRLGRLPWAPVDWSEINAAWGQTALLLSALARKLGLKFKRYNLVPYGNHSYIEVLGERRELPLYGSGGFKFFWDTKFDAAMVAFLDCLQQFKEAVEKSNSGFCLPYRMDKGKIEDSSGNSGNSYSVKIQFNSEEQWTKALKFVLTNLKWGLAWVSSHFPNGIDDAVEQVVTLETPE